MSQERTMQDLFDVMNTFATHVEDNFRHIDENFKRVDENFKRVDENFKRVDENFKRVDENFKRVDENFKRVDENFKEVRAEIKEIKSTMVTKDHLDKRLAELRDELILLARKTNTKLTVLIEELVSKKSLDVTVAARILALEPFPQT